ncbi:MAG: hypothetical protein GXO32_03975 [Crenarchaeota archaeon]|nr:hypothetical protein [Thermoproteota archaeon]
MKVRCTLSEVEKSYIPSIYLWTLKCDEETEIRMDIHRLVAPFKKGDKVEVEISKEMPHFVKGQDFAARGYVITKRIEDNKYRVLISLWGFLVVIESSSRSVFDEFEPMDEIYMVIRKV